MNLQTTEQKVIQLKKNKNNGNRIEQTQERWHQIDKKFCSLERGKQSEKKTPKFSTKGKYVSVKVNRIHFDMTSI